MNERASLYKQFWNILIISYNNLAFKLYKNKIDVKENNNSTKGEFMINLINMIVRQEQCRFLY